MQTKKQSKRPRKFLKRAEISRREKAARRKLAPPRPKMKFTKRSVAALPFHVIPEPTKDQPVPPKYYVERDSETPNLYLRVTPTTKTFFWMRTVDRKPKRVNIGRYPAINPEQARDIARDIAADYVMGIDRQAVRVAARDEMTLGDLWKDYREHRRRRDPDRVYVQKGKTYDHSPTLDYIWKSYFKKKWKNTRLSDITHIRARRMILDLRKQAPIGANRIQRLGQALFTHAKRELRWEGKGGNPFDFALASERGRERSKKKDARVPDIQKFIECLQNAPCSADMRLLFLCALRTGRRIGEVKSMRWDDLDLDAGLWFLKTKTDPSQKTWLPAEIVDELKPRQPKDKTGWVFPGDSKPGHITEYKKAWEQVRKAAGLPELQARDLRSAFISGQQERGVPIAAVAAQVGHANIATTARHYSAFSDAAQKNWLDDPDATMTKAGK